MEWKDLKQNLFSLLEETNRKVSIAESCTGGLISAYLCEIPGISQYFEEGYVTYSIEAKIKTLGIKRELIETYGVVSRQVAEAMAQGAAKIANADCAIATTGIAGPTGGTTKTPIGCVWIGCMTDTYIDSRQYMFQGNRETIQKQAAIAALEFLYEKLSYNEKGILCEL